MFDSIGTMPLHPLVLHAVVVGAPLAALLGLLFALPRTRNWARWPLALVAFGTAAAGFVTKESGQSLQRALGITPGTPVVGPLVQRHAELADELFLILIGYAVIALLNAVAVTRPGRGAGDGSPRVIDRVLPAVLVLLAVVVLIWTYRVGDIGARAVWNPTGTAQF